MHSPTSSVFNLFYSFKGFDPFKDGSAGRMGLLVLILKVCPGCYYLLHLNVPYCILDYFLNGKRGNIPIFVSKYDEKVWSFLSKQSKCEQPYTLNKYLSNSIYPNYV